MRGSLEALFNPCFPIPSPRTLKCLPRTVAARNKCAWLFGCVILLIAAFSLVRALYARMGSLDFSWAIELYFYVFVQVQVVIHFSMWMPIQVPLQT